MAGLKLEDLPEYAYNDYQLWEGKWELIAGIPYSMGPVPVKKHQKLLGHIFSEIASHMDDCPDCEVLIDEDWKVDTKTVLKPDVSVVCNDDHLSYITKTPDIIFEVLSPSTAKRGVTGMIVSQLVKVQPLPCEKGKVGESKGVLRNSQQLPDEGSTVIESQCGI